MERWSKIAEWFDLNREKITLVAGGIGVVFSLLGIRLGLPFDWAWFTILLCGLPIVWSATVASVETKSEHPLYMLPLMVYWLVMWLWRIVFAVKVAP